MENEMKVLLKSLVASMSQQLATQGIGKNCPFDKTNFTNITIDSDISDNLVYKRLAFYEDENTYVFVKDGSILYQGLIDSEGAEQTIISDILTTKDFINFMLAISNDDIASLESLLDTPETLENIGLQLGLGYSKGVENNHY